MDQIVLDLCAQIAPEVDLQPRFIRTIFWNQLTEIIKAAFPTTRGDSMHSKNIATFVRCPVRPASGQRGMIFYQRPASEVDPWDRKLLTG